MVAGRQCAWTTGLCRPTGTLGALCRAGECGLPSMGGGEPVTGCAQEGDVIKCISEMSFWLWKTGSVVTNGTVQFSLDF